MFEWIQALVLGLILLLVAGFGWILIDSHNQANRRMNWEGECRAQGGLVVRASERRLECFIDNKRVILKGYEDA